MPKIIGGSLHEHRERTRIKLFSALASLMLDRGFDAITLADIAAKAGVGRTAVYNHFADKESLLLAYMTHETQEYVASLESALEGIEDPVEQLRTYVRRQAQLKRVYRLSPGPDLRSVVSPATQAQLRSHATLVETVLRRILEQGMAAGEFAPQPLDTTVSLVNACLSTRATADGDPGAVAATEEFVLRALGAQVPALP
ncbi:TetR/AcrR family transcriptional regulator [Isoptericola sp. b441]|uniref:TetR/AcrR family transcriptional regulator n=1 Tax=Actinotalea lenta TaxID=3064654 RepID=A0ABT9D609_9CELL|nr:MULTISPECIES: TetR/AcrR family transcriptional regulator [unclassified Isoptericola]MDO8106259.1 TetR/AcrR family transcriptional regulator [Isoptericola sp. b441]MDO8122021.1 TetR/AcrR family transcriptional regulator [Isoptericola sp. b490]